MPINEQQITSIVDRVVDQLVTTTQPSVTNNRLAAAPVISAPSNVSSEGLGCFSDIESAIAAAELAYREYKTVTVEMRKKIIASVRRACMAELNSLARLAIDETGLGRYEDKLKKNEVAILKTPGVEDLEPVAYSGDKGLTIEERAPYGIIGSITPCTNPSETIISNAIGMIAGGNTVVFNPHPSAKKTSVFTINLINKAVLAAGGPPNLLTTVLTPTIESANVLMKHPKIALLVVTGGPAVVNVAMKSGKKVIAAGPGNPPVVVDETADIDKAGHDIVMSAGTDNNIICVIEKNIIATRAAADNLKKSLVKHGAVEISSHQARRLEKIIVEGDHPNKNWVGKDIQLILRQIGLEVGSEKRIAFAEVDKDHPFARIELLLPVLPFIRVKDVDEAIEVAYELEGGCFHTAVMHSRNIDHLHKMALKMNTSIFVKNGPALAGLGLGGEGAASFTIASPTGEGVTTAYNFTRRRRCTLSGHFRIV